jgi:hypothetical protein
MSFRSNAGPSLKPEHMVLAQKYYSIIRLLDELDMKNKHEREEFKNGLRAFIVDPAGYGYDREQHVNLPNGFLECAAQQYLDYITVPLRDQVAALHYFPLPEFRESLPGRVSKCGLTVSTVKP